IVTEGAALQLLETPAEYFGAILSSIRGARSNITLCALYFGTGEQELRIIRELEEALSREGALRVCIMFDYCRSTRKSDSSLSHFHRALSRFGDRVQISLYKIPLLEGMYRWVPSPVNETLGVYHCKFCVFDDAAFISGANLSRDYFTNRQDRYLMVKGSTDTVRFLKSFYNVVQCNAYSLSPSGDLRPPRETSANIFKERLELCSSDIDMLGNVSSASDTVMYPVIQHHSVGVRREMDQILEMVSRNIWKDIVLSSPYCSYTPDIAAALRRASRKGANICILTSSREAHGFHGATGLAGIIPELHDISLANLMQSLSDLPNISTMIYTRPGWTFHAKGVWCFPHDKSSPILSYIGSSNGGERSWFRDFELGFVVATGNKNLKKSMVSELNQLRNHCTLVKSE
ncbi:unnamed protein product, partial [Ectocarpus fasciculatus]